VLLNLVGNAVKFTESGSVTVTVRREGEEVEFEVTDTGPGIPPETLVNVFKEFERGAVMDREGAGLGLAISDALAGALGGTLTAESEVGVGSTFRFRLPEYARRRDVGGVVAQL
jgi:signal transduction histidine kinase